jgi:hypothetical protein
MNKTELHKPPGIFADEFDGFGVEEFVTGYFTRIWKALRAIFINVGLVNSKYAGSPWIIRYVQLNTCLS